MTKDSNYHPYTPPLQALNEAGSPVTYEPYLPGIATNSRTVLTALRSEDIPQEEIAIADGEFLLMDIESAEGESIGTGETKGLLTFLGKLSLQYVVEREQLPMPGDDKRTLKLKRRCRVERAIRSEVMTRPAAEELSGALRDGSYMLIHSRETLRAPKLLHKIMTSDEKMQRGYVLDYSDQAEVRSRLHFEAGYEDSDETYAIAQTKISPADFTSRLEIGVEERHRKTGRTASYESLYRIVARQHDYRLASTSIESAESPGYVTRDEMLFAIAILDQAIKAIRETPPYPEHDAFIKKLHKQR